jgi:hypothetical protein
MTKRIPGAKRGRPPTPKPQKPPAKRSGRKPVAYIGDDNDKHTIALTDALLRLRRVNSENAACDAVAPLRIGDEITLGPNERTGAGGLMQGWQKRAGPGIAATFKGYATTLRGKRHKYRDARSIWWRRQMTLAVVLALSRGVLSATADDKAHALALASSVGEAAFAERELFAMIDARDNSPATATFNVPELTG